MADNAHGGDYDAATGKTTTGHSWDGISELNTPLPRWWLYTLYGCIVWAMIYWVLFPAWPWFGGATKGLLGWNSRTVVAREMDELRASRSAMNEKLAAASLQQIEATPELLAFARAEGAAAFAQNCSPCHGAGAQGSRGYPNLNADRWLWGGTLDQIHTTITHGARWTADPDTHAGVMPSFGRDGLLNKEEISTIADYVRTLSGNAPDAGADLAKGKQLFIDNCSPCHGEDGKGNVEMGAANLTTQVWLYGPTKADIMHRIEVGGGGVMPAWKGRIDETTIKALTVFVHTLGGGK
ncbi:cytochrome c oxidase, cbb3-type, subunit III [Methylocella silvestris BL2]|uniref:Cbb3-type cytochrome c oxidase subunit n=1 Tax=Methylocella silvestris (strain DSM 15510 / CIP 108128 / LMG 27833 / NCIMB 13906 / BL2) TaxID=395965 RepID=B8EJ55_METSB|nr:cytochrome-c oxidase, cbb3-type subunit III [Methylocella silvestris]ACK52547.1 cytochrome c oxidase, cbb3-type, subunit III [Methylocella silvestris BL2]